MDSILKMESPVAVNRSKIAPKKKVFSTEFISPDTSHELTVIPHCIIHPTKIVFYREFKNSRLKSTVVKNEDSDADQSEVNQSFLHSQRKNNGYLSDHAKRKLFKAIDYMIAISVPKRVYSKLQKRYIKFRVVFVTLTLPNGQKHSDKEITNKLFNQFLIELSKYHGVKNYVWRAEKQENGNIHYHLLINEFIEWQELRKRWNRICNKLGYVDSYQAEMKEFFKDGFRLSANPNDKRTIEQQRKAFIIGQKSDWTSPNSTDIHDTRRVKNIRRYVGKYMAKQPEVNLDSLDSIENVHLVSGRLWSCDQKISSAKGLDLVEDWQLSDEFKELADKSKSYFYQADHFSVLYFNVADQMFKFSERIYNLFCTYIYQQFSIPLNLKLAV
jgi:hypothetical protein